MKGDAKFSPDRKYRYMLSRTWAEGGLFCLFICLNPSTADEVKNDPTITRCVNFARDWGFSSMLFGNLFALRSTDPKALYTEFDPVGPENDYWLKKMASAADRIVLAWGEHGRCRNRGLAVLDMVRYPSVFHRSGEYKGVPFPPRPLYCFAQNKSGQPKHPLYLPRTDEPVLLTNEWLEWKRDELRTPEQFKKMYMGEFAGEDN